MQRTNRLRCQILSSCKGSSRIFVPSVLSNSRERNFSQPVLFLLINGNKFSPRSIYLGHIANQTNLFSTMAETILVQARDPAKLSLDIQHAIDDHRYDDAWKFLEQHMEMEGFPRKSVVKQLIVGYAETLDSKLIDRTFGLVEKAFEEGKQNLFEKETLIYLALALARCSQPVPASVVLRKLISMGEYPPVSAWSAILAFMCLSSSGAYLSAELILEIGYLFQDNRIDPRKKSNATLIAMKPNTLAIGVAVAGCLVSGTTRIAEQLLDMMPRIGVKIDATLLVLMAHIYERNDRIDQLKKLKRYFDEAHGLDDFQFRQYYNCLLNCHLKFGDLHSASQMVLEMLRKAKEANNSLAAATLSFEPIENGNSSSVKVSDTIEFCTSDKGENQPSSFMSFEEFCQDRNFICLEGESKKILMSLSQKIQKQVELIITERGIPQATEKTYVKLAKAFLESGKIKDLAEFLIKVEKKNFSLSVEDSVCVDVINSCISLGWLDQAHDLLDELRYAGIKTSSSVYSSLLKAYCKEKRTSEVMSLLREVRKVGIQLDASCYETLMQSRVLQEDTQGALRLFQEMKEAKLPRGGRQEYEGLARSSSKNGEAGFMAKLLQEIKEGEIVDCGLHDWNNVIHFFCKKRLMQDAEKALKKMRSLGHTPNAQTFHSMVTGYAAIGGKYIEVAELWGEMKSLAAATPMKFDQELLDSVLYTFVRGGFFVRANEVVKMMEEGNMFIDKYRYRTLFLKYHKTLFKGKAPNYQTEAQLKKRDATLAFKKWVGLF